MTRDAVTRLLLSLRIRFAACGGAIVAVIALASVGRALAAGLLVATAVLMIGHGVLAPLRRMTEAAERLAAGDLEARAPVGGVPEVHDLAVAFNAMAARLGAWHRGLEASVAARTEELELARAETLERLARAAEFRDDDTQQHAERIGRLAARVGARMGMEPQVLGDLRRAAPLHDIGKIAVPDAILLKPGRLTEEEFRIVRHHTTAGAAILGGSSSPVLRMAEAIALCHHERWDGGGYPQGRRGDAIPLEARIVAVVDVFDALTHERPYKDAWPLERALEEIRAGAGTQFDPAVVSAFLDLAEAGALAEMPGSMAVSLAAAA